ncbi:MAG: hypothetical protein ACKO24_06730 [Leptolyngbyaceae cyanobacterium]
MTTSHLPTDYVLFVHGVKTRQEDEFCRLASALFHQVQASIANPARDLRPIYFFWGNLNIDAQNELKQSGLEKSDTWSDFWFRDFRTEQVLEFVGDAALYLSRHIGSEVVRKLVNDVLPVLKGTKPGDRLHLVTHSWGTVILFDILFASRWEDASLDATSSTREIRQMVAEIRNALFGLGQSKTIGIPLASISTMGSPLALFTLLSINGNSNGQSSHQLAENLKILLETLFNRRNKPLPWLNFAHPGDPIAYPLKGPINLVFDDNIRFVDIQDVMTTKGSCLLRPFSQRLLPLLWGGQAHGSYWENQTVATTIGRTIALSN